MVAGNAQQKDPTNNGASVTHGRKQEDTEISNNQNFPNIEPAGQFTEKLLRRTGSKGFCCINRW